MLKFISREVRAILLLFAVIQIVSGATVNHGKRHTLSTPQQRDNLIAQNFGDMGATMKCLLELERPEIYDKIYNTWNEHLERIQLHPTKPMNPDLSMNALYEKGSITLNQLQSIDEKCSSVSYKCSDDATTNEDNTPKDLQEMGKNLQILSVTMKCALKQATDEEQLHRIFDNSFERMHSNYDAVATPLSKVNEEILDTTREIKILNGKCEENACIQ